METYQELGYYSSVEPVLGKLIVIGDTHFSKKYKGSHKNYTENSIRVANKIVEIVSDIHASDGKVSLVILGDIFGVSERNINDEPFLSALGRTFDQLNGLCDGRVYCVRGNHDMGEFTTFDFAVRQGWFKNPMTLDYSSDKGLEARFHILNYGHERRELDLGGSGVSNVAFGHNNFVIPSVTVWYENEASKWRGDHVDLASMDNLQGVKTLVSGHIHTPNISKDLTELLPNGDTIRLYYLGSPSRVAERFDDCYYMVYDLKPGSIATKLYPVGLWPVDEEFEEHALESDEQIYQQIVKDREKKFHDTLQEMIDNPIAQEKGIVQQIENHPGFTQDVRQIALTYYQDRLDKRSR